MKVMKKHELITDELIESTIVEKNILLNANHPFLVGMNYVFQTEQEVCFVMRLVRGGELFSYLREANRFKEPQAQFYIIQVASALGHLHKHNIVYRDLKPENVLMEENGYICVADFGMVKVL